jgi:hypothetical protein
MPDVPASSASSSRWSSIVWKLTVFVGVVIALRNKPSITSWFGVAVESS